MKEAVLSMLTLFVLSCLMGWCVTPVSCQAHWLCMCVMKATHYRESVVQESVGMMADGVERTHLTVSHSLTELPTLRTPQSTQPTVNKEHF